MASIRNVVVGMSGGVDSAVAALLLKKKGFNVTGVFMKNWDLTEENASCTFFEDLEDARFACNTLKIPFKEVNFVKEYWNEVFINFTEDYQKGQTPNPDILCNKHIKFHSFLRHAFDDLKADALATGHYARTSFGTYLDKYDERKSVKLLKAKDALKDQTFFLSQVSQIALRKTMFPLGDLTKAEVKEIAHKNGLEKLARKPESMGICFIGSRNFQKFISQYVKPTPGKFINIDTGTISGFHNGVHLYTIGQRCKIGGLKNAMYIVKKNPETSNILVAPGWHHPALFSSIVYTETPHWVAEPPPNLTYSTELDFRFQHKYKLVKCKAVLTKSGKMIVIIEKPIRALTPGQYSVFYSGNECLGSAKIVSVGPLEFSLGNTILNEYSEIDEQNKEEQTTAV